jgi:hypothetical protein
MKTRTQRLLVVIFLTVLFVVFVGNFVYDFVMMGNYLMLLLISPLFVLISLTGVMSAEQYLKQDRNG